MHLTKVPSTFSVNLDGRAEGVVGGTNYPFYQLLHQIVVANPVSYRRIVSNHDHNMLCLLASSA